MVKLACEKIWVENKNKERKEIRRLGKNSQFSFIVAQVVLLFKSIIFSSFLINYKIVHHLL